MKIRYNILIVFIIILATSCDDDILYKTNPNQFTVDQYYKNGEQLTAATNAVYANFTGSNLWGRMMQYFSDCRADEHASGGQQLEVHNAQLLLGSYDNTNFTISAVWQGLYRTIHRANAAIEFGSKIENIDSDLKKQRIAEAKFLRAWAYYYLVVNWGKIPVYTETVKTPDGYQPLSEESAVYELLESDLTAIQSDLKVSHETKDLGRATKGAAQGYLAKVYLYQEKYAEAEALLKDIIASGEYEILEKLDIEKFMIKIN